MTTDTSQPLPDFDAWWDYDQPAATEQRFRELLPQADASGSAEAALELRTQIARTLSLQRRFDEAHAMLDGVESRLNESMPRARIRCWLERGRTYNSAGNTESARPLFLSAWELASRIGAEFYAVDAAHMLAIVETGPSALAWNLKALALAEASDETKARQWLGPLYNNIGWTYHDMGDYAQALTIFERALAFRLADGKQKPIWIARWCVARTRRSLGQLDAALAEQQALVREQAEAGGDDGYVHEEIAECLSALGRSDEATPYFARAYTLLAQDAWLAANETARLERLKRLGAVS